MRDVVLDDFYLPWNCNVSNDPILIFPHHPTLNTGRCHLVEDFFQVGGDFILEILGWLWCIFLFIMLVFSQFLWYCMVDDVSVFDGQSFTA